MGAVSETSRPLFERGFFRPALRFCACRLPATARRTAGSALALSGWLAGWTGGANSSGIADRSSEVRRGSGYSGQKERGLNENSSANADLGPPAGLGRQCTGHLPFRSNSRQTAASSAGQLTLPNQCCSRYDKIPHRFQVLWFCSSEPCLTSIQS